MTVRRTFAVVIVAGAILGGACSSGKDDGTPSVGGPVAGSWRIEPTGAGSSPLKGIAAFGAGGVLLATGAEQPGTGIGQWRTEGADGFVFSYEIYRFGADGGLATTTTVRARGTVKDDLMEGTAAMLITTASNQPAGGAQQIPFKASKVKAEPPT